MKLLALLIAVILLAGSLDFCQAGGDCNDDVKKEVCSPLCHCSGCVFSIVVPKAIQAPPVTIITLSEYEDVKSSSVLHMSYSIWQPPRLVSTEG